MKKITIMSIENILQLPQRKLIVSQTEIDLSTKNKNEIFILMVHESRGSAGGRGGGSGSRKIEKIIGFSCENGICTKYFETEDDERIQQFDIPYSAVAMEIKLSRGGQLVVQGIADLELIKSYQDLAKIK